jgi:hypothetical protein
MTTHDQILALAPLAEPLEPEWSGSTLAAILAAPQQQARPRTSPTRRRARKLALAGSVAVALTAGAAVAGGGPSQVVGDALRHFSAQPNTTGNGLGVLHDPELVAEFPAANGLFAFWVATSSSGTVCYASADGTWDGRGAPARNQLDYGCAGEVNDAAGGAPGALTDPVQLGGFFKDSQGPMVYGISPYPGAVQVRVRGAGVDRTLPVRADSHGFGAAIPEAVGAPSVTLTFLDASGRSLGSRTWVAPVG